MMNKRFINGLIIIFVFLICYEILTHYSSIISSINSSYEIWVSNVFPALFPFIFLSKVLLDLDFPRYIEAISNPVMRFLFNLNGNSAFVFIMSMISGSPSNAICAKELYLSGSLSLTEASRILMYTHFSSPLFILGSITSFLGSKKIAIFILIIHYITNFIIAFFSRNNNNSSTSNVKKAQKKDIDIFSIVTNSISNSVNTCLMILGVICISGLLIVIIKDNLSLSGTINSIISGLIEITNGLKALSCINLSLKIKTTLSIFFISFGGLSIHLQVLSILSETGLKYKFFFFGRIIHSILSSILAFVFFDIFI